VGINSSNLHVSIVLPTYNRAEMLGKCVDSIIAQTYTKWELIISDDCSCDDTCQIIEELSKIDKRIRYHFNEKHRGLPKNRNAAISLAKYNFIFFIEDDLILDRFCLEILINTYLDLKGKGENIGGIAPRLIIRQIRGPRMEKFKKKKNLSAEQEAPVSTIDKRIGTFKDNYSATFPEPVEAINVHACTLYPKFVLLDVGGYEENAYKGNYSYEDKDLNTRIRKKGYKLFFQSKAISYHYMAGKGGCRILSPFATDYYNWRNHIVFLARNFGKSSLYMVPLFLVFIFSSIIKYSCYSMIYKFKKF